MSGLAASAVEAITVDAGEGNDQVTGGGFTTGDPGQVSISGGGDDVLVGKSSDVVKGGPGNDVRSDFGATDQVLDGEAGTDTYAFDFTPAGQVGLVGMRGGKTRRIALGKALVVADGGDREVVKVSVSHATKKAIASLKKRKLKVAYDLMDVAGNVAKGTATVEFRLP